MEFHGGPPGGVRGLHAEGLRMPKGNKYLERWATEGFDGRMILHARWLMCTARNWMVADPQRGRGQGAVVTPCHEAPASGLEANVG